MVKTCNAGDFGLPHAALAVTAPWKTNHIFFGVQSGTLPLKCLSSGYGNKTCPQLYQKYYSSGLQAWYQDSPPPTVSQYTTQLMIDQTNIGWASLVNGWHAQSWHLEQEQFCSHIHTCKSSKHWTKKLWDVAWDLCNQQNEALHADPSNHDILESQVNNQIWLVYEQGSTMLPHDALALPWEPLSIQLQKPLATKTL